MQAHTRAEARRCKEGERCTGKEADGKSAKLGNNNKSGLCALCWGRIYGSTPEIKTARKRNTAAYRKRQEKKLAEIKAQAEAAREFKLALVKTQAKLEEEKESGVVRPKKTIKSKKQRKSALRLRTAFQYSPCSLPIRNSRAILAAASLMAGELRSFRIKKKTQPGGRPSAMLCPRTGL